MLAVDVDSRKLLLGRKLDKGALTFMVYSLSGLVVCIIGVDFVVIDGGMVNTRVVVLSGPSPAGFVLPE